MSTKTVVIIGGGVIAQEYARVLKLLNINFYFVVRSEKTKSHLSFIFPGIMCYSGGIEKHKDIPSMAIVATQVEYLIDITKYLVTKKIKSILVEKPLSYSINEIKKLQLLSKDTIIQIALNRLYYPSVLTAERIIKFDGGIRTISGDFTEAIWRIPKEKFHNSTLNNWIIANSIHVISTVFYLSGVPEKIISFNNGINPSGLSENACYSCIGYTNSKKTLINLKADWGSAGSWSIEITTPKSKLFLSPIEKIIKQELGSFEKKEIINDFKEPDGVKPGFFNQTKFWLEGNKLSIDLEEYIEHLKIIELIETSPVNI